MPITEATDGVEVSTPSRLRTQLNIAAAVVGVGLCLAILALLANTPPPRAAHRLRPARHACSVC